MQNILAIILNWNELDYTRRCLESIYYNDINILVVDNHSNIDPSYYLLKEYPNLKVIRNASNLGVAGGRNVGIRYALDHNFDFVLLFDNDAYADSKFIEKLLHAADMYTDTGLFGPKIYFDGNKGIIWRAGCTSWKWTYLHAGFEIFNRFCRLLKKKPLAWLDTGRGENQKDMGQFDLIEDIDFQIGCAQFIRTQVFREIGLLDNDFSPYGSEDIDFCARLTKHGWKIKYIPEAKCWHRAGSSFNDNYKRNFFNMRNLLLLSRKNLHPLYFAFLFVPDFFFLTVPLILVEGLLCRHKQRLKGFIDGIKWNYLDISKRGLLLKKRSN